MSVRTPTQTRAAPYHEGMTLVTWLGITENDEGGRIFTAPWGDKTVQVYGDFGTGGAITMQGSPDGVVWAALHDVLGADIVLTDTSPAYLLENTCYIRPLATAGSGANMNVKLVCYR